MTESANENFMCVASAAPCTVLDAADAFVRYQERRFFPALDGLRFVSILAVIIYHAGFLASQGWLGVEFFFVISGYLITTLLLRERRDIGDISLKRFYIRRTLRIMPLYFTVFLIYLMTTSLFDRHSREGREFFDRIPYFLTYTSNLLRPRMGHFILSWSLSTEEQFYLLWPILVCLVGRPLLPVFLIASVGLGEQVIQALITTGILQVPSLAERILTTPSPAICLGCVVAYTLHYPKAFRVAYMLLRFEWLGMIAGTVALIAVYLLPTEPLPQQFAVLGITLMGCVLVAHCVVGDGGVLKPVLTNRAVRYIGVISYGIYLTHLLCLHAMKHVPHVRNYPVARLAGGMVLTLAVASFSYRFYEVHFLKLKDRLAGRPKAVPADR